MKIYYRAEISSAHKLSLPYDSKCLRHHGHNYLIEAEIYGKVNNEGMVIDFTHLKEAIYKFDHINLNDYIKQPTAENIAIEIIKEIRQIPNIENINKIRIRVWEDKDSYAEEEWVK